MPIKRGDVVSHCEAIEWGIGKVVELTSQRASIQFNDGIIRKIACSHFTSLLPAERSLFLPIPEPVLKGTTKAGPKKPKIAKAAKVAKL
jgi:hypothetical protein